MKRYIFFFIIGLILFVSFLRSRKVVQDNILFAESNDWLSKRAVVMAAGRSFAVKVGDNYTETLPNGFVLHVATFGNSVIASLKEGEKVVKAIELNFDEKTIS